MPDLRLRADGRAANRRPPQDGGRQGGHHLRGRGTEPHRREGRRRHARRPLDFRPEREFLRRRPHLRQGGEQPQRAAQRQLFPTHRTKPFQQGGRHHGAAQQHHRQRIRRRTAHQRTGQPHPQRADGQGPADTAPPGGERHATGKIPRTGTALPATLPLPGAAPLQRVRHQLPSEQQQEAACGTDPHRNRAGDAGGRYRRQSA